MKNTTVFDKDLNPVLEIADNEDLEPLVEYITEKFSGELTKTAIYKKHAPDHAKYADFIAKEIRDMGGNSIANVYRGEGPSYHEMVCDVAEKFDAPFNKSKSIAEIESSIFETILSKAMEEMSEEEINEFFADIKKKGGANLGGVSAATILTMFRAGGFYSYQITLIIANQVARIVLGHGLKFAANAALMRFAALLSGPVGIIITSAWTVIDLAGPAYKVTIPCVLQVALIRKKLNTVHCGECEEILQSSSMNFCQNCGEAIPQN